MPRPLVGCVGVQLHQLKLCLFASVSSSRSITRSMFRCTRGCPSVSCALLRWYACLLLQFVGSLLQTVCCVVVWLCGCVAVWLCGCVAVWLCGCVAVSLCRCVVVSLCRCVVVSLCRCVVVVVRCKKRVQVSKKLFRTIQPSVIHPSVPSSIHSFIGPLIPSFLPSFCTQHSAPPTTHGRTDGRNTQHTTNKLQTAHSLTH